MCGEESVKLVLGVRNNKVKIFWPFATRHSSKHFECNALFDPHNYPVR